MRPCARVEMKRKCDLLQHMGQRRLLYVNVSGNYNESESKDSAQASKGSSNIRAEKSRCSSRGIRITCEGQTFSEYPDFHTQAGGNLEDES